MQTNMHRQHCEVLHDDGGLNEAADGGAACSILWHTIMVLVQIGMVMMLCDVKLAASTACGWQYRLLLLLLVLCYPCWWCYWLIAAVACICYIVCCCNYSIAACHCLSAMGKYCSVCG
jgi:hypothetical protein